MRTYNLNESVYNIIEFLQRDYQLDMLEAGLSVYEKELRVDCDNISNIIKELEGWRVLQMGKIAFCRQNNIALALDRESGRSVSITISAPDQNSLQTWQTYFTSRYEPCGVTIKWMYEPGGNSVELPISGTALPQSNFYPQLGSEDLSSYYGRFMASSANVLLLIGPPGTGKTTFIRGLLHHTGQNAMLSYDSKVLEDDRIFAEFMSSRRNFMILEDADSFLASRSKGNNTVMHKFLNVGDGLFSTKNKKLIFSTNLPSVRDVDDALLRPGRCFDVMRFEKMGLEEAKAIRADFDPGQDIGPFTLAEILAGKSPVKEKSGVGFV